MNRRDEDCGEPSNEKNSGERSNIPKINDPKRILEILGPFIDAIEKGRPLPPLLGIISQKPEVVEEFKSGFRKLQDMQGVPEDFMISNANEIIQLMASSENSCLTLSAEDFISKYWRYLWRCPRAAASAVLAGLDGTRDFLNRESLYRVLHKIQREARRNSGGKEAFEIADLLPQIVKDIEAANQCDPTDTSGLPTFVAAALPQKSEHIVCAYALECLVLRVGNDPGISFRSLGLPRMSRRTEECIRIAIRRRNAFPCTPPKERDENIWTLEVIDSWGASSDLNE